MQTLEVARADLSVTRVTAGEPGPPRPGEALFVVERFGFPANNVTYALLGEHLRSPGRRPRHRPDTRPGYHARLSAGQLAGRCHRRPAAGA
jgi:hypothetical protein